MGVRHVLVHKLGCHLREGDNIVLPPIAKGLTLGNVLDCLQFGFKHALLDGRVALHVKLCAVLPASGWHDADHTIPLAFFAKSARGKQGGEYSARAHPAAHNAQCSSVRLNVLHWIDKLACCGVEGWGLLKFAWIHLRAQHPQWHKE